jgi:hypothetical protein
VLSVPDACLKLGFSNTGFCDVRAKYDYEVAIEDMIERTSTRNAPWHIVPANDKPYGRLATFTILIDRLGEGLRLEPSRRGLGSADRRSSCARHIPAREQQSRQKDDRLYLEFAERLE